MNWMQFLGVNMASNGLVMSGAWSSGWHEYYSRVHVMSCHIRTLSPISLPQTSLIATDSHHVLPSVDTVNAADTYLHSPLSCPALEWQGRVWSWKGALTSDLWLTAFNGVGRQTRETGTGQTGEWDIERENKGEEERKESTQHSLPCFTHSSTTQNLSPALSYPSYWDCNQSTATVMCPLKVVLHKSRQNACPATDLEAGLSLP